MKSLKVNGVQFARAKIGEFFQEKPKLYNPYTTDGPLKRYLQRLLPAEVFAAVKSDLARFGDRIVNEIDDIGRECELNLPQLKPFDAWGCRIDKLITSSAWKRMKVISAEEGLVACGYENKFGEYDRLYQYAKNYLCAASNGLFFAPLAATDGAAKLLKENYLADDNLRNAFERLTSRNPEKFWLSAQWMTEKKGGSDVANGVETLAYPRPDGLYSLHGYKWFASIPDAEIALALARTVSKDSTILSVISKGTKGLSLFLVKVYEPSTKKLNNIEILRLKDKLGTRQVATAELLLDGTVAQKISPEGRGVAMIANMLNITRIHNAIGAISVMRKIIFLSRDYMFRRNVFGKTLVEHPLHVQTVARLEVVPLVSEGLESFGGIGYLEDTGLPSILRDAQFLPISEGTTNVLSFDVLRHLAKEGQAVMDAYKNQVQSKVEEALQSVALRKSATNVQDAVKVLVSFASGSADKLELAARDFSLSLAKCYIGALLLEHASSNVATDDDVETAIRWCQPNHLILLKTDQVYSSEAAKFDKALVLNEYPTDAQFRSSKV